MIRLLGLIVVWLAAQIASSTTYVLIFGNTHYPTLPSVDRDGKPIAKELKGAKGDALAWHKLFVEKYPGCVVKPPILDAKAADFWTRIAEVTKKMKPGDTLLIFYSGHGIQKAELMEGGRVVKSKEPDGLEEYLFFSDGKVIHDNELRNQARSLAGQGLNVVFVFDCCFSGGLNKDPDPLVKARSLPMYLKIAYAKPPKAQPPVKQGAGEFLMVWASGEKQEALEFSDPGKDNWRGAFSRAMTEYLTRNPKATIQEAVDRAARVCMAIPGRAQAPNLDDDGGKDLAKKPFYSSSVKVGLMVNAPALPRKPTTYALIITESDYRTPIASDGKALKGPDGKPIYLGLKGPANDGPRWRDALIARGVDPKNVQVVENANAKTFSNAIREFDAKIRAGDQALFLYSGHGRSMPSKNEPDGNEEWLVLSDLSCIPDDDMGAWMDQLKARGVNATFVYDCCYSGGLDKPLGATDGYARARSVPFIGTFAPIVRLLVGKLKPAPNPPLEGTTLFVAASGKSQPAYEREFLLPGHRSKTIFGSLSWFLVNALERKPTESIANLIHEVALRFREKGYDQVPVLIGSDPERESGAFVLTLP